MFFKSTVVAALLAAVNPTAAHMFMKSPAPVFANNNEFNGGKVLDTYTAPISGRNQFPCRDPSVIQALGTPAGTAVADWAAGSSQTVVISGGAFHGGGSCQLALSYDKGATFKVIKSFIGNCPSANGDSSYNFDVPADAPSGEAVFAWTWFNQIGNREMYMNCAVVNVGGGASKREISHEENQKRAVAFASRPNIFVANIDGTSGCQTKESIDVDFPNPGEEVERNTQKPGLYIDESKCPDPGNTGAGTPGAIVAPGGGDSDNGNGDAGPSSTAPKPTTAEAATSTTIPGGVFVTTPPDESTTMMPGAPTETMTGPNTMVTETMMNPTTMVDPTTMMTSTRTGSMSDPADTTMMSSVMPSPTAMPAAGAMPVGEACTEEGMWNCIGGTSFQRCASGMWSAVMEMASGTSCQAGMSETLVMFKKRGGARIVEA